MLNSQINKSYTLIEFLIVLAIISLLSTIIIYQLKPIEYFQNIRDSKRINDLKSLETILNILTLEDKNLEAGLSTSTIYISLVDNSPTCSSWIFQLPSLPSGWQYKCSATPTLTNGQGWIPIDFTTSSKSKIIKLNSLPIDPINKPPYYYAYVVGGSYKITAKPENNFSFAIFDNGIDPLSYELGTNLKLPHTQSGLVLYFPFDEVTGTIAYDLSISKNNATLYSSSTICSNNCPQWVNGKVNNAILLERSNSNWLAASNSLYIDKNLSYTFLAWIKTNIAAEQVIFQNSKANDNRNGAGISNNIFKFGYYDNNGWKVVGSSSLPNTFNFVVGINKNGDLSIYINNNGPIKSIESLYIGSLTNYLYIGRSSLIGEEKYFDGIIDEFRIYNRALSEKEVKVIYEATK